MNLVEDLLRQRQIKLLMYNLINFPAEFKNIISRAFAVDDGKRFLLFVIYIAVNFIVLTNAILHNPFIGYDVPEHLKNIQFLASLSWPDPSQSEEFFSPPLPYVLPALTYGTLILFTDYRQIALPIACKIAQIGNLCLSLGLTLLLLRLCEEYRPKCKLLKIATLLLLGILPVYYKTFSQVRPEPYVAFFFVLSTYIILRITSKEVTYSKQLILGISLGLLILSRQWGFFLLVCTTIFFIRRSLLDRNKRIYYIKSVIFSMFWALLVGGWFYGYLYFHYGRITAFNRSPASTFAFSNQPLDFYFGLSPSKLFSSPIRPNFANQLIPIIYSETWGDYWGYFLADKHNLKQAPVDFLARLNIFGLFPTFLLLGAYLAGLLSLIKKSLSPDNSISKEVVFLLSLIVTICMIGYGWFLIRYPSLGKGDTLKATYLIYIFPFLCLLAADLVRKISLISPSIKIIVFSVLFLVGIHNLPGLISRRWWF